MILHTRVRPINTNKREIILPKSTRAIVKPLPVAAKTLKTITPKKSIPQQKIISQPKHIISRRNINAKSSRSTKPSVSVVTRDPPESSTRRLRDMHNKYGGNSLVIIGNGPSISEIDTTRLILPNVDIMSINKPDMRIWPTKHWLFCDITQLKRHHDIWSTYNGYIFNSAMINESRQNTIFIKNIHGYGFSTDLTHGFHIGRSSVYAAMQVGLWLGYDKIYIFGCDMGAVVKDGKEVLHFYGTNLDCTPESRKKRFSDEAKYYDDAGRTLSAEIRQKFFFCSSYNQFKFIDYFNRLDHQQAVDLICEGAQC